MANGLHKYTVQEAENAKIGQGGYVHGAASAVAGTEYVAITALSAAQIDTTSDDTTLFPDLTNVTIPVGTTIYGAWERVSIKRSGSSDTSAIVYKG